MAGRFLWTLYRSINGEVAKVMYFGSYTCISIQYKLLLPVFFVKSSSDMNVCSYGEIDYIDTNIIHVSFCCKAFYWYVMC